MRDEDRVIAPGRRRFIVGAGALTTGAFLPNAVEAAYDAAKPSQQRIACLIPEKLQGSSLVREFLAGFQEADSVKGLGLAAQIVPYTKPAASVPEELLTELATRKHTALIALMSRNNAAWLEETLSDQALPCLVCDVGADIVRAKYDSTWLVRHSLGYWQTSHAMGDWSAKHLGKRALIATDYLESGHDLVYSFHYGFVVAGGEQPVVHVNNASQVLDGLDDFFAMLQNERPDFIYALYSGERAKTFLKAYAQSGSSIPLAGPALLTQALDGKERFPHAERVIQASSWSIPSINNHTPMALLGYEAALRLASASTTAVSGAELAHALARTRIESPRGTIVADPRLADICAPWPLEDPGQVCQTLTGSGALAEDSIAHLRSLLKTGWTAPYQLG